MSKNSGGGRGGSSSRSGSSNTRTAQASPTGSISLGGNQRMLSDGTVVTLSPAAPSQVMAGTQPTRAPMREPGGMTAPAGRNMGNFINDSFAAVTQANPVNRGTGSFINDSFAAVTQANPPNRSTQMALSPGRGTGSVAMGGGQRMLRDGTVVSLSPASPPQSMREPAGVTQAFRDAIRANPKGAAQVARTIPARDVGKLINSTFAAVTQANPVNPAQMAGRATFAPSQMPPPRPSMFAGNVPLPPQRPTGFADATEMTLSDPLGFASVSPRSPMEARPERGPGVASAALAPPITPQRRSPFANRGAPSGPDDPTGRMLSGALSGAFTGGLAAGLPGAIIGGVMGGYDGARPRTMADTAQTVGGTLTGPDIFSPSTWFSGATGGALSGPIATTSNMGGAAIQQATNQTEQAPVTTAAAAIPTATPTLEQEANLSPELMFLRRITRRA